LEETIPMTTAALARTKSQAASIASTEAEVVGEAATALPWFRRPRSFSLRRKPDLFQRCLAVHMHYAQRTSALD
jgi:hypothetical protein